MRLFAVGAALFAVVALTVAAGAGAFGSGQYPAAIVGAPPPPSAAELQKLGRIALTAAADDGDAHPAWAAVVPTRRQVAEQADNAGWVNTNPPVYFIVVVGHFRVPLSVNRRFFTGGVLTRTIPTHPGGAGDGSLQQTVPNLYAMGRPEPLPLPASG